MCKNNWLSADELGIIFLCDARREPNKASKQSSPDLLRKNVFSRCRWITTVMEAVVIAIGVVWLSRLTTGSSSITSDVFRRGIYASGSLDKILHASFPSEADTLAYVDALKHSNFSQWRSLEEVAKRAGSGSCSGAVNTSVLTALYLLGLFNLCAASPHSCCVPPLTDRRKRRSSNTGNVEATLPPLLDSLKHNLSSLSLEQFSDLPHVSTPHGGRIPVHISVVEQVRKLWDSNPRLLSNIPCSTATESVRSSFISLSGVASGIILAYSIAQLNQCYPDQRLGRSHNHKIWFFPVSRQSQTPTVPYIVRSLPPEMPVKGEDDPDDDCGRLAVRMNDGKCVKLLSSNVCPYMQWVLLNRATGKGECVPRLCSHDKVFVEYDQMCHDINEPGFCPKNQRLFVTAWGEPVCDCIDGMFHGPDGKCHRLYEQSYCYSGTVIQFHNPSKTLTCKADPCEKLNTPLHQNELPYALAENDVCYQLGSNGPCKDFQRFGFDVEELAPSCVSLEEAGLTRPPRSYQYSHMAFPSATEADFPHYEVSYVILNGSTWELMMRTVGRNKRDTEFTGKFDGTVIPFLDTREFPTKMEDILPGLKEFGLAKEDDELEVINANNKNNNNHNNSTFKTKVNNQKNINKVKEIIVENDSVNEKEILKEKKREAAQEEMLPRMRHKGSKTRRQEMKRISPNRKIKRKVKNKELKESEIELQKLIEQNESIKKQFNMTTNSLNLTEKENKKNSRKNDTKKFEKEKEKNSNIDTGKEKTLSGGVELEEKENAEIEEKIEMEKDLRKGKLLIKVIKGKKKCLWRISLISELKKLEKFSPLSDLNFTTSEAQNNTAIDFNQNENYPGSKLAVIESPSLNSTAEEGDRTVGGKQHIENNFTNTTYVDEPKSSNNQTHLFVTTKLSNKKVKNLRVNEKLGSDSKAPQQQVGELFNITSLKSNSQINTSMHNNNQSTTDLLFIINERKKKILQGMNEETRPTERNLHGTKGITEVSQEIHTMKSNDSLKVVQLNKANSSRGDQQPKKNKRKKERKNRKGQRKRRRRKGTQKGKGRVRKRLKGVKNETTVPNVDKLAEGKSESKAQDVSNKFVNQSTSSVSKPFIPSTTKKEKNMTKNKEDKQTDETSSLGKESLPDYLRNRGRRQAGGKRSGKSSPGIINAPLLNQCRPGAKRDYNGHCRPKVIPEGSVPAPRKVKGNSYKPSPPVMKCSGASRLDSRGVCRTTYSGLG